MEISRRRWNQYSEAMHDIQKAAEDKMNDFLTRGSSPDIAGNFGGAAEERQWVAYRIESRNGKLTKVPVNPATGRNAMTNNPDTWGTLAQAQEAVSKFGADGVGFVFSNGYFGIDLDDVIDPLTGNVSEYALDIVNQMGSYAEISPSGRGIHIIARGDPDFISNKNGPIEMYYPTFREDGSISGGRYFTVTGNSFGPAVPIAERTEAAQSVWAQYVDGHPALPEGVVQVGANTIDYAYALATQYGEAAATLAAEMYDATALAQGMILDPAEPAPTATYQETAKAIQGTMKNLQNTVAATVGRLVKQAGADTMLLNAGRDGAEFAWIPAGDTCSFCITLASRGWQEQSETAKKHGHAEHIHANCDCTYSVRFDRKSTVQGYDPDKYLVMYKGADLEFWNTPDGKPPAWDRGAERSTGKNRINAMRRENYAQNREKMREQKRAAYAREKARKAEEAIKTVD